jgi:hypothetical protein
VYSQAGRPFLAIDKRVVAHRCSSVHKQP